MSLDFIAYLVMVILSSDFWNDWYHLSMLPRDLLYFIIRVIVDRISNVLNCLLDRIWAID